MSSPTIGFMCTSCYLGNVRIVGLTTAAHRLGAVNARTTYRTINSTENWDPARRRVMETVCYQQNSNVTHIRTRSSRQTEIADAESRTVVAARVQQLYSRAGGGVTRSGRWSRLQGKMNREGRVGGEHNQGNSLTNPGRQPT